LHGEPGSDQFLEELHHARTSRKAGDESKISGLIAAYKASPEFTGCSPNTKHEWSRKLDLIRDEFGQIPIRAFEQERARAAIKKWHAEYRATPRAADYNLQVLRRLLNFAVDEGRLSKNPCMGMRQLYSANRADKVWSNEDIQTLLRAASQEMKLAVRLALLTGLRRGDLLRLSWSHVHENYIEIKTGKGRGKRTAVIPITRDLSVLLSEIPKKSTTILTSSKGRPWTDDGFGSSWWKTVQDAGLSDRDYHFHDLRGTAATRLYAANLTEREIAETLGWSENRVEQLLKVYVNRAAIMKERASRISSRPRVDAGSEGLG
jgi:integrase